MGTVSSLRTYDSFHTWAQCHHLGLMILSSRHSGIIKDFKFFKIGRIGKIGRISMISRISMIGRISIVSRIGRIKMSIRVRSLRASTSYYLISSIVARLIGECHRLHMCSVYSSVQCAVCSVQCRVNRGHKNLWSQVSAISDTAVA